jgi:hypothetical protein
MKELRLSKEETVLLDNEDFLRISKYTWELVCGYASRMQKLSSGKWKRIILHREVINAPNGKEVDHIDRNKLNNQKSNLRLANRFINNRNFPLRCDNKSGYAGVCWNNERKGWTVYVGRKRIGIYKDKNEAIQERKKAVLRLW